MIIRNVMAAMLLGAFPLLVSAQKTKGGQVQNGAQECKQQYMPVQYIRHPWSNKRVAIFGDSLTDPSHNGSNRKYWDYMSEWLNLETYIYGKSGRQWNDIPRQAEALRKDHGDDFDAILIFIGTNDFNAAVPVGEWYDESIEEIEAAVHAPKAVVKRKARTPIMSDSTYRGRINIALSTVKRMYPDKQIILLTPIHRAYAEFSDTNVQPSERYTNACGEYIDAYVNSVKEAGNIWAVPVIDMNSVCGLYPMMKEYVPFFHNADTDMLHPNDKGQIRLAQCLYWQLLALPTF